MSTILKCRDCGYFLAETTAKDGALRLVCRRCRRSQLFRLAEYHEASLRDALATVRRSAAGAA